MRKIYICATVYHVLITLVKGLIEQEKYDIVLSKEVPKANQLAKEIIKASVFEKVIIFDYSEEFYSKYLTIKASYLPFITYRNRIKYLEEQLEFGFLYDREVYLFNDDIIIGKYLNYKKIKYNLIEDGLDCYRKPLFYERNSFKGGICAAIKQLLGVQIQVYGYSQYIKTIEVNNLDGVKIVSQSKLIEKNRKQMFESLSRSDKELIFNIFFKDNVLIGKKYHNVALLLTQPLYIDKMLDDEKQQIAMYKNILRDYKDYQLLIKPHPRDKINYSYYFENCIAIIPSEVPIEVLGFLEELSIELGITAYSTSIESLEFVKKKISMGSDYVINFNRLKNE